MHQDACSTTPAKGDPELARICELREAMALSPRQLIAKLTGDADAMGVADHADDGKPQGDLPESFAAISALANLASIVTSLQGNPLPPPRAEAEIVLPGQAPPPLPATSEGSRTDQGDQPIPGASARHGTASDGQNRLVRQKTYAVGLGLIVGLALIAAGLWLAGRAGLSYRSQVREALPMRETPPKLGEGAPSWSAAAKPELAPRGDLIGPAAHEANWALDRPATAKTERSSPEPLVEEARQRVERGDVAAARDLLGKAETEPSGLLLFTLAETYDPNMLAAWGMRGISADIARAKALYAAALALGYAAARQRLDALQ
jgi:hypothetical protein